MKYWVAQGLVEAERATVSVLDHGFTVADGVFETLKVVDGVPFALTRHLRRLARSAALLGLPDPDPEVVADAARSVCEANAAEIGPLGRLRITYTAGAGPLGSERGDAAPTLVVAVSRARPWPASEAVATVPWPRNERSPLAGLQEHVVRGERRRPGHGTGRRGLRGAAAEHPGRAVRGDRQQRLRGGRR